MNIETNGDNLVVASYTKPGHVAEATLALLRREPWRNHHGLVSLTALLRRPESYPDARMLAVGKGELGERPVLENVGSEGVFLILRDGYAGVYSLSERAAPLLARAVRAANKPFNVLTGPEPSVSIFVKHCPELKAPRLLRQFLYRKPKPIAPFALEQQLRCAELSDECLLSDWGVAFVAECGLLESPEVTRHNILLRIKNRSVWVLEQNGRAVTMLSHSATGPHASITLVYTQPAHRGRGFARTAVAAACNQLFATDLEAVTLFADCSNGAANAVYQGLGFEIVADYATALWA